jgi:glycosyltransferase involved in cell wall biosynthesis
MQVNKQPAYTGPARILHVVGSLNRGGIETWLQQAVRLLPRGYRSDFCTYRFPRGAFADCLERHGCRFYHIPLGSTAISFIRFVRALRGLLRTNRYDVVHSHGLLLVGLILLIARLERVPVRIAHSHSTGSDGPSGILGRVMLFTARLAAGRCATVGVGCSREAVTAMFGARRGLSRKHGVLHCGIDLAPFRAASSATKLREDLGVGAQAKVLGLVANFTPPKNHRFLVSVFAEVVKRDDSPYLVLVGDGPLRREVEQQVQLLGLSRRVIFTGQSPAAPEFLKQVINVFVMPSVREGLPLALLEAQAAGIPCLVSDVVPGEANVCDSVTRIPLANGPKYWADAILSILGTGGGRHSQALDSIERSDFNLTVSAVRLAELYGKALRQARIERTAG